MSVHPACAVESADDVSTGSLGPGNVLAEQRLEPLLNQPLLSWTVDYRLLRRLGSGGQGVVYLAEKIGTDGLRVPVALKFFSHAPYRDQDAYAQDMVRVARMAARVARIQQDNLLDVHDFVELDGARVMAMEWVDGFDLSVLVAPDTLRQLESQSSPERWSYLNDVVITRGKTKSRLKPGVAVAIVRECLAALASLHREGIVHGDVKPSNIMLKRTGNAKIIDLGSACQSGQDRRGQPFTPRYSSPEVLRSGRCSPYSDLVSLGYVLVELLAGQSVCSQMRTVEELIAAKRRLVDELPNLLPPEVLASESLMHLVTTLISPETLNRVPGAEAADLVKFGAADFHHELVNGNLASEYETEIRLWLRDVSDQDRCDETAQDCETTCATL